MHTIFDIEKTQKYKPIFYKYNKYRDLSDNLDNIELLVFIDKNWNKYKKSKNK